MDNKIRIKQTQLQDVFILKNKLRQEDIEELEAQGLTPEKSLLRGYIYSEECFSVFEGDMIIGMYGVSTYNLPLDTCSMWFLGSEECIKHPVTFVKEGLKYIKTTLKKYRIIMNKVYAKNIKHIKWLEKLGVKFMYFNPIFINENEFIYFYKIRN